MLKFTRRQFAYASGATLLAVTGATSLTLGAAPEHGSSDLDPMSLVDPELRGPLQAFLQRLSSGPPMQWTQQGLERMRGPGSVMPQAAPLATPAHREQMIPGPKGAPEVRIFVINATSDGRKRPAVLHMHGGGYILGRASDSVRALQQLTSTHDCVAVTVDYRLAPETRFPGSLEDNYAALRWLYQHADELGVDRNRIAVMGESAGGGHAAALAIAARDRGEVPLVFQVLIYPMLDDRTGSSHAVPPHIGKYIWTAEANRFGWGSLLGVKAGSASVPPGSVPARVQNLAGLAPAFIGVGSIDLFVDEDLAYAQRLINAGIRTEVLIAPGAYHAFDGIVPEAAVSKSFTAAWNAALKRAFAAKSQA
jgi:acetyl esterase/lipase